MAAITVLGSFAGAALAAWSQGRKAQHQIQTAQAVTDTKLDELTREVREHNGFARRMPVVEEQIRGMDRRLEQLEQGQRRQPIS